VTLHSPLDLTPFLAGCNRSFGYIPLNAPQQTATKISHLAPIHGKTSERLTLLQMSRKNCGATLEQKDPFGEHPMYSPFYPKKGQVLQWMDKGKWE